MGYIGIFIVIAIVAVGTFLFVYSSDDEGGIQAQLEAGKSAIEEAHTIQETLEERSRDISNE